MVLFDNICRQTKNANTKFNGYGINKFIPFMLISYKRATQEMPENRIEWCGSVMRYNSKYRYKLCKFIADYK